MKTISVNPTYVLCTKQDASASTRYRYRKIFNIFLSLWQFHYIVLTLGALLTCVTLLILLVGVTCSFEKLYFAVTEGETFELKVCAQFLFCAVFLLL